MSLNPKFRAEKTHLEAEMSLKPLSGLSGLPTGFGMTGQLVAYRLAPSSFRADTEYHDTGRRHQDIVQSFKSLQDALAVDTVGV